MINELIFKSYDVRGVYPAELNEDAAYWVGRALAHLAKADRIVVGSDMRLSGPALKAELIRGITESGVNVVDVGLVSIDGVYFSVGTLGHPAGVMITASHNPKEYNGFKMVLKDMVWVRGTDIKEVVDQIKDQPIDSSIQPGTVTTADILPQYIQHVLSFCDPAKIKPLKVVVDAGNGMAGKIVPLLAPHLPITIVPLNFELDGNFPAHPSNPLLAESQVQITQAVVAEGADFGVIFDGDTDRLFFIDETGTFIRADYTLLLLAKEFLQREPGKAISYNAVCSKIVPEKVTAWGGRPIRTKVGFVNVSDGIRKNDGIMGGELSAHYCFRDNNFADSGFIAWMILLQLISQDGRKLSEMVTEFQTYYKPDEHNLTIAPGSAPAIVDALITQYADGTQDQLDGLTVQYPTWWFNVRASNTEPLLRITIEADTKEIYDQSAATLIDFVQARVAGSNS
jgi:phosphomannomutase